MHSVPFTLVSVDSPNMIFAFGLEIIRDGDIIEAITYRRDPGSDSTLFGVHESAMSACGRYGMVTPLVVHWQCGEEHGDMPHASHN